MCLWMILWLHWLQQLYWGDLCYGQVFHPPFSMETYSILTDLSPSFRPLVDRVIQVEEYVCGEICATRVGFPGNSTALRYTSCQTCHCDAMCRQFRDCCPDVILKGLVEYEEDSLKYSIKCIELVAVPYETTKINSWNIRESSKVVVTCPFNFANQTSDPVNDITSKEMAEKCSNPDISQAEQSWLVTSKSSGFTYRNKFCAQCHNDTHDIELWTGAIGCHKQPSELISDSSTKLQLFGTVTSIEGVNSTGCELYYVPVDRTMRRDCSKVDAEIISSCNITGQWSFYDKELEEACAMYTSIFNSKYRNIFCYLCNSHGISLEEFVHQVQSDLSDIAEVSFSAMFDFHGSSGSYDAHNSEESIGNITCDTHQYYDPISCQCQTPSCSEGKYLKSLSECQSLVKSNIIGYHFCAEVVLDASVSISDDRLRWFIIDLSALRVTNLQKLVFTVREWCHGDKKVILDLEVLISPFLEHVFLEDLERNIDNLFKTMSRLARVGFETEYINSTFSYSEFCPMDNVTYPCGTDKFISFQKSTTELPIVDADQKEKMYFIEYSQTSLCPFVILEPHILSPVNNTDFYIHHLSKELIHRSKVETGNGSLYLLCVPDYLRLTESYSGVCKMKSNRSGTWTVAGLVSIICTCISLLCLLLTFITYAILDPLRSEGGKNIMTLTVALFAAQAFYEFAIEQYENSSACKAFGIIIHYTWLAAVFSMNACTVDRFCKLCFPLESRTLFLSRKPFIMSTVYTLFCPLIIVTLNVFVNLMTSGDIGYGSPNLCFINAPMSRIMAFGLPMGMLILVNAGLFLITVWSLRRRKIPRSKFSSSTKVSLGACVRLSIVTGLTWLLAFLYDVIDSQYIGYVITAIIGLQGVMFFFSLVINRRVIGLYKVLWLSHTLCRNDKSQSANVMAGKQCRDGACKYGQNKGVTSTSTESGKGSSDTSSTAIRISTIVPSTVAARL